MSEDREGKISRNIKSLQWQISSVLEEAGGDAATRVLDKLSNLERSEQKLVLRIFERVVSQIVSGDIHLETKEDRDRSEFEENLLNDIQSAILFERARREDRRKFHVIDGGRNEQELQASKTIDLDSARERVRPRKNTSWR